jgi:phenylpropionate dioxygenase-like ring-hydroxylating dioxygenase large terminal subunit
MLSKIDNETACRVGPGTPMGNLMRQYWLPALLSRELPHPDSDPVRVVLLGEKLIAFRDTNGQVGLIHNHCPHRGASLFFGRNEEAGLRCVYHGWKFDVQGSCIDMPNEPAESDFETKVTAITYPTKEHNGLIWAYMGPRETPPPRPDLEANNLSEGAYAVGAIQRECNYLQGLEGDIDTSHFGFLHFGAAGPESAEPGTFQYYALKDRAPRYQVVDTEFGSMYSALRPAEPGTLYHRIALFLFPIWTMIPTGVLGHQIVARGWVPMDDEHTMFFSLTPKVPGVERAIQPGMELQPNTTDWYGRFRLVSDITNDYRIDRDWQRSGGDFTGIPGIHTQDQAVTETMGPIYDRTSEHLGSSDAMVIRTRRRLLDAARALADRGTVPPGVDQPEVYRQRSGGIILPDGADWVQATEELRMAYVAHPELDPALAGRLGGQQLPKRTRTAPQG